MNDSRPARVMLYCRATDEAGAAAIEDAYHRISKELAGTDGMLGNELIRDLADPTAFVVVSRWTSVAAFFAWESGPDHRDATSPMREYQDRSRGTPFGLYEVLASY